MVCSGVEVGWEWYREEGERKDEVYLVQWRLRSERAVEVDVGVELVR